MSSCMSMVATQSVLNVVDVFVGIFELSTKC